MSDSESTPLVELRHVNRRYLVGEEEIWAVRDASLRIEQGEFLALIGRSGSGKTTLLNLIAGLDRPDSGEVLVEGEDIAAYSEGRLTRLRRHRVGFVFQSFGLLPLLTAYENVELAMRIAGTGLRERRRRTDELLEAVGLRGRARHRPYELSGGEQQRVAIARALANRPPLILADEPTGELDSTTALGIFQILHDLVEAEGITIIATTHDRTVMELVPRVEEMLDGRVLAAEDHELLAYTTREERSHFAAELPADVREEVAATVPAAGATEGEAEPPAIQPVPEPSTKRWTRSDGEGVPAEPAAAPDPAAADTASEASAPGSFAPPADRDRPGWARPAENGE